MRLLPLRLPLSAPVSAGASSSLLLGLLLACSAPAAAPLALPARPGQDLGELSLEQLMDLPIEQVYGASKYEQRVTQAPAAVTIVPGREIGLFGQKTIAEVLRGVRGFYVSYDRNYSYLGQRGFLRPGDYNMRTLLLVDGHRINDSVYDSALLDRSGVVDVALVDRVEVIRGPGSSVYGSSAFFGVVNLITKSGKSVDGSEVSTEVAENGTYAGRYTFGGMVGRDLELLVSASYYTSAGQGALYYPEFDQRISDDPNATNNGVALDADAERAYQFFTDLRFHELTFSAFASTRTKQVPTASFLTVFNSRGEWTRDDRLYADLKYRHELDSGGELLLRAFWDDSHYLGYYPSNYASPGDPPDVVLNRDMADGRWAGLEAQYTRQFAARHTVVLGAEYRRNYREVQLSYDDVAPRYFYVNDSRNGSILGLYTQAELQLRRDLSLSAGLRFDDYFREDAQALSPRLGLIYHPQPESTIKLLVGDAFRAPNAYEQAYLVNGASLRAEKIRTWEITVDRYLGKNYKATLAAYHYQVSNLIDVVGDDDSYPSAINRGKTTALGLEAEFEARFGNGFLARASYAAQRSRDRSDGRDDPLTNSPSGLAKLSLLAPLWTHGMAGLELQYCGSMLTDAGVETEAFCVASLTLFQGEIAKGLSLSVGIRNLLDADYDYPGSSDHLQPVLPQDGRQLGLKVDYTF